MTSPNTAQNVLKALILVYADLWGRHQGLLHVISQKFNVSIEPVEREVAAWIRSHSDDLALQAQDQIRRLLRDAGISDDDL
jgi:hypothetical protein